jgi:hypothetical protein
VATNGNWPRPAQHRSARQRGQSRLTVANGKPRRPTVTPEVAGSSPVAPVRSISPLAVRGDLEQAELLRDFEVRVHRDAPGLRET